MAIIRTQLVSFHPKFKYTTQMDIKNEFDGMPDFDHYFRIMDELEQEEREIWKPKPRRSAAKKLYEQGWKIFVYTELFCESLIGEEAQEQTYLIRQNSTIICPKIVGAEGGDNYIILMENASIIRTNMHQLLVQLYAATMMNEANESYADILRDEIDVFREYFKKWVSLFEKDDCEDDWGLY